MGFRVFLALAALYGFAASEDCDRVEMLQASVSPSPKGQEEDRVQELKKIAWTAAKAKSACKRSRPQRCSALQQEYQRLIRPRIEKVLGHKLAMGKPRAEETAHHNGYPIYWETRLNGCIGRKVVFIQPRHDRLGDKILTQLRSYSEANALIQGNLQHGLRLMCFPPDEDDGKSNNTNQTQIHTLVRNPLTRLHTAYNNVVAAKAQKKQEKSINLLAEDEVEQDTSAAARAFIEDYFQRAAGTVRPQLEYPALLGGNCSVKFNFLAGDAPHKVWQKLVKDLKCDEGRAGLPYRWDLDAKGQSPSTKEAKGKDISATDAWTDANAALVQGGEATVAPSSSALEGVLLANERAYLLAFCWYNMVDYVTLNYDLPNECLETDLDMGLVYERAWTWRP